MHLIIDGYNIMHALPVREEWSGRSFQDRRASFLDSLKGYAVGRSHRITVVFDGAKGGDAQGGAETYAGIQVLYSARGVEADQVLRDIIERAASPEDVLLVTSDKSVSEYARSLGASVARADELIRKLRPSTSPVPHRAEHFEMRVKGYRPDPAARHAGRRRSKQRHQLW